MVGKCPEIEMQGALRYIIISEDFKSECLILCDVLLCFHLAYRVNLEDSLEVNLEVTLKRARFNHFHDVWAL